MHTAIEYFMSMNNISFGRSHHCFSLNYFTYLARHSIANEKKLRPIHLPFFPNSYTHKRGLHEYFKHVSASLIYLFIELVTVNASEMLLNRQSHTQSKLSESIRSPLDILWNMTDCPYSGMTSL